jgi:hypothetical protein
MRMSIAASATTKIVATAGSVKSKYAWWVASAVGAESPYAIA